jgi:ribonuclease HI
MELDRDTITIFTDGATRGNGTDHSLGAFAYSLHYKGKEKEYAEARLQTTNNIQELLGIIKALSELKLFDVPVVVYSDSKYCIRGITENWIGKWKRNGWLTSNKTPVANKELWMELDSLVSKFQSIKFEHIHGHSDNEGNDHVDLLCNQAMDKYLEKENIK